MEIPASSKHFIADSYDVRVWIEHYTPEVHEIAKELALSSLFNAELHRQAARRLGCNRKMCSLYWILSYFWRVDKMLLDTIDSNWAGIFDWFP